MTEAAKTPWVAKTEIRDDPHIPFLAKHVHLKESLESLTDSFLHIREDGERLVASTVGYRIGMEFEEEQIASKDLYLRSWTQELRRP